MARELPQHSPARGHRSEDVALKATDRTKRRRLVLASAAAVAVLLAASVAVAAGTRPYSIVYGDTLNDIAARHGTDVATLVGLNEITDPDVIIAGDELAVPDGELMTYTVREGDTLAKIATAHGVSVEEMAIINKLDDADMILPGEVLLVYASTRDAATALGTIAEPDDTEFGDVEAEADDGASTEGEGDAVESDAAGDTEAEAEDVAEDATDTQAGQLHLVQGGQTLADVAALYDVTEAQLIAANALESTELRDGMILKVPAADSGSVELIGMPTGQEQWPLMSEIAAASVATAYWGAPVTTAEILESLDSSDNPHFGFRGDPQGMFGGTDDYGVYNEPLAEALASFGFTTDAFYADGDATTLTSRIDAGIPVIVWVTHELGEQERTVVEDELGRYSLIPEQHAAVVYGYDDAVVRVIDVATGQPTEWDWDAFMASWALFDGMGLGVELR